MPRPAPRSWIGAAAALFAVGWGANQFASLLLAYRLHSHITATTSDALFGVYAVGLIPALLVGGPLSDRRGRRLVVPVIGLSGVATATLMLGGALGLPALYAGRFVAGVVSGLAFAPGTAWVKELSSPPHGDADDRTGARRAAIALSAGFGTGPLVAGLLAQYAPDPTVVPYVPHLLVLALVAPAVARAPETVLAPAPAPAIVPVLLGPPAAGGRRRFAAMAGPMAPWVFAAAAVSFAVLPASVTRTTRPYEVAFAAVVAGLTLAVGVGVQPLARRLDAAAEAGGVVAGLALVTAGLVVGAAAAARADAALVLAAAALLGAGYGTCLGSGLLEVQRIAAPDRLAGPTAVFYALTYVGFSAPIVVSGLSRLASTPHLLLAGAALAGATALVALAGRARYVTRPAPAAPPGR